MDIVRFIGGIAAFFTASNLLQYALDIQDGTTAWIVLEIFSDSIGIIAAGFISREAAMCIALYMFGDILYTIWDEKGFFNILLLCLYKWIPIALWTAFDDKNS